MYVQAGVSARCGQILRLRARGQQAMGKGMRTERGMGNGERGNWKEKGARAGAAPAGQIVLHSSGQLEGARRRHGQTEVSKEEQRKRRRADVCG